MREDDDCGTEGHFNRLKFGKEQNANRKEAVMTTNEKSECRPAATWMHRPSLHVALRWAAAGLLEGRKVVPKRVYLMGGPAMAMQEAVRQRFELFTVVPEHFGVANAIGAALTRNTASLELFADTEKGIMFIPALRHRENVPRNYSLKEASRDALNHLLAHLSEMGVFADRDNAQVTHATSFNMVEGGSTTGRNIRVKCQIKPGVAFTLAGQAGKRTGR